MIDSRISLWAAVNREPLRLSFRTPPLSNRWRAMLFTRLGPAIQNKLFESTLFF